MALLVTPSFFETNYSGLDPEAQRVIAKRFIYIIKEFDENDKPLKYWSFCTSEEGKLRIFNAEKYSWKPAPIYPGTYHFYVTDSNIPIENPKQDLNKSMCGKPITVSKEIDQQVIIPCIVIPTFYETNFSALNTGEKRKIANRYIYVVKEFESSGTPRSYEEFRTSNEGKLGEGDPAKNSWKTVTISPGSYYFHVTDSDQPIPDPKSNLHKDLCGKPILITEQKEQEVIITYKDGNLYFAIYYQESDDAFKKVAETWRKEMNLSQSCTATKCYLEIEVKTEPQFKKAWSTIYDKAISGHYKVLEGRLFTHSYGVNLEFAEDPSDPEADNQYMGETSLEDTEIEKLKKLPWDKKGLLGLHGCNTGNLPKGSPAEIFCKSQNVRTYGQMGFAYFSENQYKFDRADLIFQDDDPRYLWAFKRSQNLKDGEEETGLAIPARYFNPPK